MLKNLYNIFNQGMFSLHEHFQSLINIITNNYSCCTYSEKYFKLWYISPPSPSILPSIFLKRFKASEKCKFRSLHFSTFHKGFFLSLSQNTIEGEWKVRIKKELLFLPSTLSRQIRPLKEIFKENAKEYLKSGNDYCV